MTGPAVVVVGGGLVGCCVAYRLAQRGVKVTVVERGHPGCEASSAAGGILVPEARADVPPALLRFWLDGLRYYPEFVAEVHDASGVAFEARFPGRLVVAVSDDEAREMADFYRRQVEAGVPAVFLSGAEALQAEPNLSPEVRCGVLFPEHGQVDNALLSRAVAIAAQRAGATILTGRWATHLVLRGGRVEGVDLGGEVLGADAVVVAAGAWTGLFTEAGPVPVGPAKGQILALSVEEPRFSRIVEGSHCSITSRADGRLIVGSTVEDAGYDKTVTAEGVRFLLSSALRLSPALRAARLHSAWAGLRPVAPDRLPVIGPGPVDGLYYASGHFKMGILLGPITGAVVADLVTGRQPSVPLASFDPRRFAAGGAAPASAGDG